jgi:DNA-binding LytR/AlgR family response regulator
MSTSRVGLDRGPSQGEESPSRQPLTTDQASELDSLVRRVIDRVPKSFWRERMGEALDGAVRTTLEEWSARMQELLRGLEGRELGRLAIKDGGRTIFIDPRDMVAVEARRDRVLLEVPGGPYLFRASITTMAARLNRYGFIRIHRSTLVNSSFVEEITARRNGQYSLVVKGGKEYSVTRTYKSVLKVLPHP